MLQNLWKKKAPAVMVANTPPPGTHAFQTGNELLAPHTKLLNHIKRLSSASNEGFDTYYLPVIERFIETMQLLPVASEGQFSKLGGMVEKSLLLIIESLRVRQGYLLPIGSTAEEISKTKELWTFVVFVGALVHRCGQGIYEFEMVFFDKRGNVSDERYWPGISKLPANFCYYKIRKLNNITKKLERHLPLILLRTWLGEAATNWVLSDDIAMDSLLSAMVGGGLDDKNSLSEIIKKAYAHLTKEGNVYSLEEVVEKSEIPDEPLVEEPKQQPVREAVQAANEQDTESAPDMGENPPLMDESGAVVEEIQKEANREENVDWLNEAPERFIIKLTNDIQGGLIPNKDFELNDGLIKIRYPQGLKNYTKSPSDMRMNLKQSVVWSGEEKMTFNGEKNVRVISLQEV